MREAAGKRLRVGDLFGGLAGAAVALPQSMGLGVVLFAAMGLSASAGALAGLIGAAALSLVSGIAGYTRGMISAPNGPVTMLLSASLVAIGAEGVSSSGLVLALAALVMLAGLIQLIIGLTGGGQLIKFIPYPMVAGLVTAIGILMMRSQLQPLLPMFDAGIPTAWVWVPAATAALTFAAIKLAPHLLPSVPGVVVGLVVGLAGFHLAAAMAPMPVPDAWVVGAIPKLDDIRLDIDWDGFDELPWELLFPAAAALAVLASIDCLVTAVVADSATGGRHNARGELAAQGVGQMLAGLLGGIGGGGTKGST
ncbi:MAG: SulP family inorganic anion transporter, partial [Thiohalocapsa sp.]